MLSNALSVSSEFVPPSANTDSVYKAGLESAKKRIAGTSFRHCMSTVLRNCKTTSLNNVKGN